MTPKRFVIIGAVVTGVFCTAWGIGNSVSSRKTPIKRVVKNLVLEGNPEETMEVGRKLLLVLREHNWNWREVYDRDDLMRVPDQEFYRHAPNGPGYWTWSEGRQVEYRDEVAFTCNLYTWDHFTVIPGSEGRLHPTGFYIVGWKDGRVERVPVEDTRLYPITGDSLITVFPGMSEYDVNLPRWGSPDISEKLEQFKARRAIAARK